VSPDGNKVYVTNVTSQTLSVIDAGSNTVTATIPIFSGSAAREPGPRGLSVTPDGSKVYVANGDIGTVAVIDAATNTVTKYLVVEGVAISLGVFIAQPEFAGTPGTANCHGQSVSALAKRYGGIDAAAASLGFPSVQGLQDAVRTFCA
jgi:YVTN family beta-propeller protein